METQTSYSSQQTSPSLLVQEAQQQHPRDYPFHSIVNHEFIKQALLLAAINPFGMGGMLLAGGHGTGKSVLARSIRALLPSHIQLSAKQGCCDAKSVTEAPFSKQQGDKEVEASYECIPTPFVTVPANVMEDNLLGFVDLEESIKTGKTEFTPGLLAKAHGGVLFVDDLHLLDEHVMHILLNAISDRHVRVEREGHSVSYPCQVLLMATYNPNEGEVPLHLLDKISICLSTDAVPLSTSERVKVVQNVEAYMDGSTPKIASEDDLPALEDDSLVLQMKIENARARLPYVQITKSQILYLCQEATRAGCQGQRAELYATEIAKTHAALEGRTEVNANDLQLAVVLAIVPRGIYDMDPETDEDSTAPSTSPPPPPPSGQQIEPDDDTVEPPPPEQLEEQLQELPQEFMFGVDHSVSINPKLLLFPNDWARKGSGGKRAKMLDFMRGRFVKAIFPRGNNQGRIAVGATLRAAAPHQVARRQRQHHAISDIRQQQDKKRAVYIGKDDVRIQQRSRKSGSLVIFVVDASGSMALNRMGAAKGAAIALLQEAYKSRDKICLVAFHDEQADVIVPPTRSVALTKNRLEAMPCGGGSPLAHALMAAMRTGLNAIKVKKDVARVVLVVLTDGRANVPLCVSEGESFDASVEDIVFRNGGDGNKNNMNKMARPGKHGATRAYLKEEVLAIAKILGSLSDFNLLCIDTEDKFVGTGMAQELAQAAGGHYFHLAKADRMSVAQIAKKGMAANASK